MLDDQNAERQAYQRGRRPQGPRNDPQLLVIDMDGGCVQNREKRSENGSRWREDKVLTISRYLPGDGQDKQPKPLVTTYLSTMNASDDFGALARLEAERRGIRQTHQAIVLGDGTAWIDTPHQRHFHRHVCVCASSTGITPSNIFTMSPKLLTLSTPTRNNLCPNASSMRYGMAKCKTSS